jgi:hypothetical protein
MMVVLLLVVSSSMTINQGALPCRYELIDPKTGDLLGNSAPLGKKPCKPTKEPRDSNAKRRRSSIFQKNQFQVLLLQQQEEKQQENAQEELMLHSGQSSPIGSNNGSPPISPPGGSPGSVGSGGFDLELAGSPTRPIIRSRAAAAKKGAKQRAPSVGFNAVDESVLEEGAHEGGGGGLDERDDDHFHENGGESSPSPWSLQAAAEKLQRKQFDAERRLLAQAAAVGAKALEYPAGRGALQYESFGEVAPYGETHHAVSFSPLEPGYYYEAVALRFINDNADSNANNTPPSTILLTITGTAELFPIYAVEPVMNLRTVVHGKLYRKKLKLRNRGKIAFKVIYFDDHFMAHYFFGCHLFHGTFFFDCHFIAHYFFIDGHFIAP